MSPLSTTIYYVLLPYYLLIPTSITYPYYYLLVLLPTSFTIYNYPYYHLLFTTIY